MIPADEHGPCRPRCQRRRQVRAPAAAQVTVYAWPPIRGLGKLCHRPDVALRQLPKQCYRTIASTEAEVVAAAEPLELLRALVIPVSRTGHLGGICGRIRSRSAVTTVTPSVARLFFAFGRSIPARHRPLVDDWHYGAATDAVPVS